LAVAGRPSRARLNLDPRDLPGAIFSALGSKRTSWRCTGIAR
jgi:hypothetical protein